MLDCPIAHSPPLTAQSGYIESTAFLHCLLYRTAKQIQVRLFLSPSSPHSHHHAVRYNAYFLLGACHLQAGEYDFHVAASFSVLTSRFTVARRKEKLSWPSRKAALVSCSLTMSRAFASRYRRFYRSQASRCTYRKACRTRFSR